MTSAADELEFYAIVDSKFRKELKRQNDQFIYTTTPTKNSTTLKSTDWSVGSQVVDATQIDAVRATSLLLEEKITDPIIEAASDFLNLTNPHQITDTFKNFTNELENWKKQHKLVNPMPDSTSRDTRSAQARKRKKESESYRTIWTNVYGKITKTLRASYHNKHLFYRCLR